MPIQITNKELNSDQLLIEDCSEEDNRLENKYSTSLSDQLFSDSFGIISKYNSFAENLIDELFGEDEKKSSHERERKPPVILPDFLDEERLYLNESSEDQTSAYSPAYSPSNCIHTLATNTSQYLGINLNPVNRRHSADVPRPSGQPHESQSNSIESDRRNMLDFGDEPLFRRHSFNSIDLNRKLCLNELALKTNRLKHQTQQRNSNKSLKINFLKNSRSFASSWSSCCSSKTVGYNSGNSESNLSRILSTESISSSITANNSSTNRTSDFKQYNKVTLKSFLNKNKKSSEKRRKETKAREMSANGARDEDYFASTLNASMFLNSFVDSVILESIENVRDNFK